METGAPALPPPNLQRRGRRPFRSAALNTYTLPGVHGTLVRWIEEAVSLAGAALPLLLPLVGLCVVTPLVSVVAGFASEMRPGWPCLKTAAEVGGWGGGRGGAVPRSRSARGAPGCGGGRPRGRRPRPPPPSRRAPPRSNSTTTFGT